MTTLKSFSGLKKTPDMLADAVGRKVMDNLVRGRYVNAKVMERSIDALGVHAELVRKTAHYRVASSLLRRDG